MQHRDERRARRRAGVAAPQHAPTRTGPRSRRSCRCCSRCRTTCSTARVEQRRRMPGPDRNPVEQRGVRPRTLQAHARVESRAGSRGRSSAAAWRGSAQSSGPIGRRHEQRRACTAIRISCSIMWKVNRCSPSQCSGDTRAPAKRQPPHRRETAHPHLRRRGPFGASTALPRRHRPAPFGSSATIQGSNVQARCRTLRRATCAGIAGGAIRTWTVYRSHPVSTSDAPSPATASANANTACRHQLPSREGRCPIGLVADAGRRSHQQRCGDRKDVSASTDGRDDRTEA